jgi:DNA-directed RNA polymerase specialized sigma24 family protein
VTQSARSRLEILSPLRLQRGGGAKCHTFVVITLETRVTEPRPISAARDDRIVADYDARFTSARDRLVRVCTALVGTDAAEDVVHDAYLRGRSRFVQLHDLDLFESWLTRIAINLCVNRQRRARSLRDLIPHLIRGPQAAPRDIGLRHLSTSAAGGAFLRAVRETGLQFEEVTALELRVDGSCDAFFTLFQGTCQHLAEPVEPFTDCPILPPAELPSGAFITAPRPYPGEPMVSWGSGTDTVTELPGHRTGGPEPPADGTPVAVRGFPGYVIPVGDVPGSQVQIGWEEHGCRYVIWIAPEDGVDAATDYAARFGGEAGPAPTAAPPVPVTTSVEEDQIRVTITLDRGQSVFGHRVWAEVSVENVGADVVHWGHSGTCDWVAGITVVPAFEVPPEPYGRDDWTGDAEILKRLAADDLGSRTQHFTPEPWVDFEGNRGCTTDFVADTIDPGERLTHRAAWDTMGAHGAPPVPGEYAVTAIFSYLNRGPAPVDDGGDLADIDVIVPLQVDGSPIAHLSPRQALDAVLQDATYQQHLADAPRERWLSHELAYEEGTWTFTLYLRGEDREIEVVERLIASVDAFSGVVLDVRVEPGGDVPS